MANQQFDVFLCHNSEDKPAVIEIAQQLKHNNLKPWLDVWELPPGSVWQSELEKQIQSINAAAVFVGKKGIGPWQNEEINAFLQEFIKRGCPVIPVILANTPQKPDLSIFLRNRHFVDFRIDSPNPLDQLVWGITKKKREEASALTGLEDEPEDFFIQKLLRGSVDGDEEFSLQFTDTEEVSEDTFSKEEKSSSLGRWLKSDSILGDNQSVSRDIPEFWLLLTFGFSGFLGYLVTVNDITPAAVSWAITMVWAVVIAWDQIEISALFMAGALAAVWNRLTDYDSGAGFFIVGTLAFLWAGILAVVTVMACAVAMFVAGSKLRKNFPYEQVFLILMGSTTAGLIVGMLLKMLFLSLHQPPVTSP